MRIPKYRRHSSGQGRVTIAGKTHYLGKYNSKESKQEYNRLMAEWLASGRSKAFNVKPNTAVIAEMVLGYLAHAKIYYRDSPKTLDHMKRAASALRAIYDTKPASEFGPVEYRAVRQSLITKKRSRVYVNDMMKRVLRIFRWAAGQGMISGSVHETLSKVESLKLGRTTAKECDPVKPVADDVVDKTIPFLPPAVRDMVKLQRLIGCRPGELCAIKPGMVDRSSSEVWAIRLTHHKTRHQGKERILYVGPQGQDVLRPYLLRGADEYCFRPRDSERKRRAALTEARVTPRSCGNKVGTNRKAKPKLRPGIKYTPAGYNRAITRACRANGIEEWSPNQLRHAVATKVRKEFGLESAAAVLGHADIKTTLIYAEKNQQLGIEAAKRLG